MRFGSTAKVLLKCKLKYYRISECVQLMRDRRHADKQEEQARAAKEWRDKAGAKGRQKLLAARCVVSFDVQNPAWPASAAVMHEQPLAFCMQDGPPERRMGNHPFLGYSMRLTCPT